MWGSESDDGQIEGNSRASEWQELDLLLPMANGMNMFI